eukprot:scaffold1518_cov417-Prasinococcus_capsulatus_cf.AAC.5
MPLARSSAQAHSARACRAKRGHGDLYSTASRSDAANRSLVAVGSVRMQKRGGWAAGWFGSTSIDCSPRRHVSQGFDCGERIDAPPLDIWPRQRRASAAYANADKAACAAIAWGGPRALPLAADYILVAYGQLRVGARVRASGGSLGAPRAPL